MNVAVEAVVKKRLGGLPAVAQIMRRLELAEIVDELCPVGADADVTHGQVVEVLVANRLTGPMPLQRVGDWAAAWAVDEVFGVESALLNDDRLARALDAIAPHLEEIAGSVGARAIGEFGIDVAKIHWDMTSMSLHGAYPEDDQDPQFPQVKYGHPKDRRVDLKQAQAGLTVTGDGGIPVFARVFDGGAAEVSQVVGAIQAMQKIAAGREFLLIGDSKLVSWGNITALEAAEVEFIAPAPAAKTPESVFAALDFDAAAVVDYVPGRLAERPGAPRDAYRVLEDQYVLTGPKARDKPVNLRRVLVHSAGNAAGQAAARDKRLSRARQELDKVAAGAGKRCYKTEQQIAARVGVIAAKRRVADCLRTEIGTGPDGRPFLSWCFDAEVLDAQAAADGWYALLTNRPADTAGPAQVLLDYKGQSSVENRYGDLKGPLAVAPIFLQHNRRVAALIQVICLALLVFCLIERQVRNALGGDQKMPGLYPDNRRVRPTGRMILYHLGELALNIGTATDPPTLLITRGVQIHLLDLLGIEVT
jgi:transposase